MTNWHTGKEEGVQGETFPLVARKRKGAPTGPLSLKLAEYVDSCLECHVDGHEGKICCA